jgi:putative dimethyl sulfoxide reductase chaperone
MSTTSGNTLLAPDAHRAEAAREAARADLCRFIAACYYEPDAAFVEEKLFDSMAAAAAHLDADLAALARRLGPAFGAVPLQDLLIDYTRLFLGPVQALARPYASVWLTDANQVMQSPTLDVMALYDEAGFAIDAEFRELPDHVAAELEFLYLLMWRENEAALAGDAGLIAETASLKRRFLDQHLGRWLGPFLLALHDGAQTDFYEALAELTEAFIRLEATRG